MRPALSVFNELCWKCCIVILPIIRLEAIKASFDYYSLSAYLRSDYTQLNKVSGAEERATPAEGLTAHFNALYSLGPSDLPVCHVVKILFFVLFLFASLKTLYSSQVHMLAPLSVKQLCYGSPQAVFLDKAV